MVVGGHYWLQVTPTRGQLVTSEKGTTIDQRRLNGDFSILYKADDIKDSVNVKANWFEYRIEANERGKYCNTSRWLEN